MITIEIHQIRLVSQNQVLKQKRFSKLTSRSMNKQKLTGICKKMKWMNLLVLWLKLKVKFLRMMKSRVKRKRKGRRVNWKSLIQHLTIGNQHLTILQMDGFRRRANVARRSFKSLMMDRSQTDKVSISILIFTGYKNK